MRHAYGLAYKNEDSVGDAIRESGLKRDDLYVTTKYWSGPIRKTIEGSLNKVGYLAVALLGFSHIYQRS